MRVPAELQPAREWCSALAAALDEVTDQLGSTARRLADLWPDARGREWADRLHAVRHALDGHTAAAAGLGRAIDHAADAGSGATLPHGPQLGGTGARRVDDRRGVTIPWLGEPADDDG